ncbi:uncharacterized protein LOC133885166 isoform X2 [Phragmites australis]|uniref:uncharacterized protein LOC133885166 isoform X2 n=1 Tax=Phragmites australis TaxID=29695 RepID=UPI002D765F95|nr:uncharacterized protein LOC133885166 isoform X2 [Phragmites australis]
MATGADRIACMRMATEAERLASIKAYIQRCREVEPEDFSGMTEAERAAEAEKRRHKALEEARRLQMEGHPRGRALEALARILDFDPKQEEGVYYNRIYFVDHATFDLDEESPLGPMRYTDRVSKPGEKPYSPCAAVNIFSVKIGSSDVGFPIHVYGTVIARDSIDQKCLYLFRRHRDHCQLINSKIDLKIKDHRGQDRELSKGILTIRGIAGRWLGKRVVESESLATRLSTVDVMYAVVKCAMEANIVIEVVRGDFDGKITAHTTNIQNSLVLYDSEVAGAVTSDGNGVIQLMRPVVSVYVKDMLKIVAETGDGKSCTIEFTPRVNYGEEDVITVGVTKMRVKVTWSIMDF